MMVNGRLPAGQTDGHVASRRGSGRLRLDQRPLYAQASEALRALVRDGGYAPGERLPSEIELSERLGISRPTLREALHMLEEQGAIVRRHGVGTFVAQPLPLIEGGLEKLESIERMAERRGLSTHMAESSIVERVATPAEMRALGRSDSASPQRTPRYEEETEDWSDSFDKAERRSEDGTLAGSRVSEAMVTVVTRVILADEQRVAFLTDVVPQEHLRAAELGAGFHGSVLDLFLGRGWPGLAHSRTELAAEGADGEVARWLCIPRGAPLLKLEAQLYAQDGHVVDYSLSYFVPGYFKFHVVRRVA